MLANGSLDLVGISANIKDFHKNQKFFNTVNGYHVR